MDYPVIVVRNLDGIGANAIFNAGMQFKIDEKIRLPKLRELCDKINNYTDNIADAAYMSTSTNALFNVFGDRGITLEIFVPAGKPFYLSPHVHESEAVFGRGTRMLKYGAAKITKNGNRNVISVSMLVV